MNCPAAGSFKAVKTITLTQSFTGWVAVQVTSPVAVESNQVARGSQAADYLLSVILPSLPITIVDNSLEDVIEAARLKAKCPLSFADCFAAATAIRERAALVTGDAEFKKLGKALTIDWVG